jgi:SAM-dependent methyltransferase
LISLGTRGDAVLLNRLLELSDDESVFLAEESLQDLITLPVTAEILEQGLDADRCIELPGIGVALHFDQPEEFWLLLTDRYSEHKILQSLSEASNSKRGKVVRANDSEFFQAMVEYFAVSLASGILCDSCLVEVPPLPAEERIERLETFLKPLIPQKESILEICCGDGSATQALLRLGHNPLSMDYERCDVCQALKSGFLDPKRCFVLDARRLPSFFPTRSFDVVLGFMVGLIDRSNWSLWEEIILKGASLARERVLFTVYTQKEAELIARSLEKAGWSGEVIDNRDSRGIYDQWAYLAKRVG